MHNSKENPSKTLHYLQSFHIYSLYRRIRTTLRRRGRLSHLLHQTQDQAKEKLKAITQAALEQQRFAPRQFPSYMVPSTQQRKRPRDKDQKERLHKDSARTIESAHLQWEKEQQAVQTEELISATEQPLRQHLRIVEEETTAEPDFPIEPTQQKTVPRQLPSEAAPSTHHWKPARIKLASKPEPTKAASNIDTAASQRVAGSMPMEMEEHIIGEDERQLLQQLHEADCAAQERLTLVRNKLKGHADAQKEGQFENYLRARLRSTYQRTRAETLRIQQQAVINPQQALRNFQYCAFLYMLSIAVISVIFSIG